MPRLLPAHAMVRARSRLKLVSAVNGSLRNRRLTDHAYSGCCARWANGLVVARRVRELTLIHTCDSAGVCGAGFLSAVRGTPCAEEPQRDIEPRREWLCHTTLLVSTA